MQRREHCRREEATQLSGATQEVDTMLNAKNDVEPDKHRDPVGLNVFWSNLRAIR